MTETREEYHGQEKMDSEGNQETWRTARATQHPSGPDHPTRNTPASGTEEGQARPTRSSRSHSAQAKKKKRKVENQDYSDETSLDSNEEGQARQVVYLDKPNPMAVPLAQRLAERFKDTVDGTEAYKDELDQLLRSLTPKQLDFVAKRVLLRSDIEALRACGISGTTLRRWRMAGAPVDRVLFLIGYDLVRIAREKIARALLEAIDVKIAGLKDRNPAIRQMVATELIDRVMGKPVRREMHSGVVVMVGSAGPFADENNPTEVVEGVTLE